MLTRLTGGHLLDPASGLDRAGDLLLRDERIVSSDGDQQPDRTIDVSGCVLMAGGIDLHTHIGGGKVGLARLLLEDQMPPREPRGAEFLPAAPVAGERYLDMGYAVCFEPAVIPCNARSAHAEMAEVAGIDTGGYCLLGNDDVLLSMIRDRLPQEVINDYVAWMVSATRCIAVKVVNPGGISAFRFGTRSLDVDTPHPHFGVTPGQIIRVLCRAVHEIGLVHPLHVHCSNLGVPGNIESSLATIRAADGLPIHLTHVQFHCYGADGPYAMSSAAARLAEAVNAHPNVTVDVGQVVFGQTVTISADTMHQFANWPFAKPRKSALVDVETEAGCGVVPFRYQRRRFVHSLQWAIGMELLLMIEDPARVFLTTDHPNGGPFTSYPHLIGLLTSRTLRETALAEIEPEAAAASQLAGLQREYTLAEIATMTRSAPADLLGLRDRGRLAAGSAADVVVYRQQEDRERMFAQPEYVFRTGRLVRGAGAEPASVLPATTHAAQLDFDANAVQRFATRYAAAASFAMDRLRIDDEEMNETIGTRVIAHRQRDRMR